MQEPDPITIDLDIEPTNEEQEFIKDILEDFDTYNEKLVSAFGVSIATFVSMVRDLGPLKDHVTPEQFLLNLMRQHNDKRTAH